MARRKRIYQKNTKPDPKYNNILVGKFMVSIMESGKKTIAEKIMYDSFDIIHERTKKGGLNIFEQAIKNVSPLVELKSRRVGGANYQVPVPVAGDRRTTLAIRWLKAAINAKKGKKMAEKLADELIDASNKIGGAMKKREDVHRMADANKAFAHFA
ncbi:MAG: 30S ribosomal protein S7 [Candidatus Moranbacteria bacterium GW2011_GWF2_36_839]|nr:MAG: 30S ribosomal protein S7 [Candidatus Moranbacteria bacterium GW2011_GWF1_36_78]KKQ16637.1 MAG: 30S ribosomal protein S7 [Candidatus Moranbacteria bacterium GW2011_GWF2_36_839]HAT73537.1 30S ribosomal protein S7 [Candidatus Moranbacteria bacterium]HBY11487.1 30S ribosomal protein S7 [Candidatus Moranbacteria bacterium]